MGENNKKSGLGITGMVLGIIAVSIAWIPFLNVVALIVGIIAIVFGAIAMYQTIAKGHLGKGMAIAGLVLGIVAVALFFIVNQAAIDTIDEAIQEVTASDIDASALFERLETGMTKDEVVEIVGQDPENCTVSSVDMGELGQISSEICSFGNALAENGWLQVTFSDGELTTKFKS